MGGTRFKAISFIRDFPVTILNLKWWRWPIKSVAISSYLDSPFVILLVRFLWVAKPVILELACPFRHWRLSPSLYAARVSQHIRPQFYLHFPSLPLLGWRINTLWPSYPARWVIPAFLNLHTVFHSFTSQWNSFCVTLFELKPPFLLGQAQKRRWTIFHRYL